MSSEFERVAGVEISSDSIKAAKVNAEMNGLGEKTEWLCGKAEDIFGGLAEKGFEGGKSCVVVDVSHSSLNRSIIPSTRHPTPNVAVEVIRKNLDLRPVLHISNGAIVPKLTFSPHEKDATPHS